MLYMGKRGLSAVVTTLIMILLTLVAVGMIWLVVTNILKSSADEADIGKFTLGLTIEKVKVNGDNISITVKRSPGKGDMTGIRFVLKNDTDSVIVVENASLIELELKIFTINTTLEGITLPITEISMYAITKTGTGKEVPGLEYKYDVGTGSSPGGCTDNDGDTYNPLSCGGTDCNDSNLNINPGATEICNGIDDDCDGSIDEGCASCIDSDSDGYGNPGDASCSGGSDTDCNNADPKEHPYQVWYKDLDKDKYSDGISLTQCNRPSNYNITSELIAISGDCNDNNANINPGAAELCNGVDDNCVNGIDEGCSGTQCNDLIDNDVDGKIDLNDPGCVSSSDNDESDVTFLKTWPRLVSWWRMNNNANDEMGANNGILQGGMSCSISGKYGNACGFDGVDDSINISSTKDDINFKNKDFSILLWAKINNFNADNGYARRFIVLKNGTYTLDFATYTSTNPIAFRINASDLGYISNSLNTGVWYNLVLTRNSSGYYIFVNGSNMPVTIGGFGTSSTGEAQIGRQTPLANQSRFNGTMDEVIIFNRSLSASEIQTIYNMNLSS